MPILNLLANIIGGAVYLGLWLLETLFKLMLLPIHFPRATLFITMAAGLWWFFR